MRFSSPAETQSPHTNNISGAGLDFPLLPIIGQTTLLSHHTKNESQVLGLLEISETRPHSDSQLKLTAGFWAQGENIFIGNSKPSKNLDQPEPLQTATWGV